MTRGDEKRREEAMFDDDQSGGTCSSHAAPKIERHTKKVDSRMAGPTAWAVLPTPFATFIPGESGWMRAGPATAGFSLWSGLRDHREGGRGQGAGGEAMSEERSGQSTVCVRRARDG